MKLSKAIEFTFENRPSWYESNTQATVRINARHALRLLGDIDVKDIRTYHFSQIQKGLKAEGKAAATCNRVSAVVHTVLNELHLSDLLDTVPSYRKLKEPPSKRGYFTREEMDLLLSKALWQKHGGLLKDSLIFSLCLGVRRGEMFGLKWKDVDLENQTVTFHNTKNGSTHVLPLSGQVLEMLEKRYENRIDDDKVFPWRRIDAIGLDFKKLKEACGLPNDSRCWHSIRHTTATWMIEQGKPIRSVMTVLNHRSIETTLRYAKTTDDAKVDALTAIEL